MADADEQRVPTVRDMDLRDEDKHTAQQQRAGSRMWPGLHALVVPGLLTIVLLLVAALLARLMSSRLRSPASLLLSPHMASSWLSLPPSVPAVALVPSPLDPSQLVHPDVAFLLDEARNESTLIPDILHFVIGTTHTAASSSTDSEPSTASTPLSSEPEFLLQHWLALKSASEVLKPSAIYCHVAAWPASAWWSRASKYCTQVLRVRAMTHIFGRPVHHRQHKADILRLEALLQWGGVALDLDVLTTASWKTDAEGFALLFRLDFLVGLTQSVTKNWADRFDTSFVAAKSSSPLLREWYTTYRTFDERSEPVQTEAAAAGSAEGAVQYDDHLLDYSHTLMWTLQTVRPHQLTQLQPSVIGVPYAWEPEGVKALYNSSAPLSPGWTVHLWQGEHERRREVRDKDGRVQRVDGVVPMELGDLYAVNEEADVCALAAKGTQYGRSLLQAMNGGTVGFECPKG